MKWGLSKVFEDRLRIAAVGYRVKVSRMENCGYFGEELCAFPNVMDAHVPNTQKPRIETEESQLGRTPPRSEGDQKVGKGDVREFLPLRLTGKWPKISDEVMA